MIRRILALLAAALPALPAACAAPARAAAMFRGDAAHLGVYDSPAPALKAVKWRFHAGGRIVSSPAVYDGVVYVGSSNGNLYAVRERDGSLVWKAATHGAVDSSPAASDGLVFASSVDGNVYAFDAASGAARWTFATAGERRFTAPGIHGIPPANEMMPDPFDDFLSSPALAGGTVYVGSGDGNVYAIDAATGKLRWKYRTGDVVHSSPAVAGGTVYVGSWDRYFYALDAQSGALRWKFQTGDDQKYHNQIGINGSAAVAGGMVYFGCRDSHFYALDAKTGALAWTHDEHGSWVIGSPAVANGTVYYTTSDERKFFALDARTGAERFHAGYGAYAFSSPSLAGGVAYFGTFDGRLYAVNATSGDVVGHFATDASLAGLAPHLDAAGNLDLKTIYDENDFEGVVVGLHRVYALGSIVGSPAIAGGVLFVGATDGTLYAVE